MSKMIEIPWGRESLPLSLPEGWRLTGVLEPSPLPPAPDAEAEVRRSLAEPIGSPRLRELARAGMRVALVVDDISRPTPAARIVPHVLEELRLAGVQREAINLIPALGVHRPMAEAELAQRIGAESFAGLRWENPAAEDSARLVYLGTTSRGTPVWVNRTAAEAELIVSVGCIEPHIIASFGGGYKNLIPGVAGRETIAHNHALNCSPGAFNMVGQPIEKNPMRLDLEEAGRMLKPPVFIVNAVLNPEVKPVRVVSGDPILAHREGVRVSAALYGVGVSDMADVVISSSHPMDSDLRQGVKALANTIRAVKSGGTLITLVRAEEGVGVFGLAQRKLPVGRGGLKALAPLLVRLVPRLKMRGLADDDKFFLYFALQAMMRARLLLYGPTIPEEIQTRLPFVEFASSPDEAIQVARRHAPREATVLVFPHAGVTYPQFAG